MTDADTTWWRGRSFRSPIRLWVMRRLAIGLFLGIFATSCNASQPPVVSPTVELAPVRGSLLELARRAATGQRDAVAQLRAAGPEGLRALLETYDAGDKGAPIRDAIDQVAQQRDAHVSRLFWHTDLESAKSAAKESGKPILSLRMLGRLDEELSCANSRFFRTVLYANTEVSSYLRDHFVLHWSSERPVPIITIDFRDGRKILRTITGNSLHYILDGEGRPVDAVPGLYGPAAFKRALMRAEPIAREATALDKEDRGELLRKVHGSELQALRASWASESNGGQPLPSPMNAVAAGPRPSAVVAVPIAVGKSIAERPMVRAMLPTSDFANLPPDQRPWPAIAARHADDARVDAAGRALMRAKTPMDWSAAPTPLDDAAFDALVARFERAMAEDTVRNEYTLHAKIRQWLAAEPNLDFTALNARVYTQLFLTPKDDPWLGLVPPGAFTGLENDGVVHR